MYLIERIESGWMLKIYCNGRLMHVFKAPKKIHCILMVQQLGLHLNAEDKLHAA